MTSIVHWNQPSNEGAEDQWDIVVLGGLRLPGIARVAVKLQSDLDPKKPAGAKNASITDKGDKPSEIQIELQLTDKEDLQKLEEQLANLRPRAKAAGRAPLEIVHPNPNFWGITAVTIDSIDAPHPDAVEGWSITIGCIEWWPQPQQLPASSGKQKPKGETEAGPWKPFVAGRSDGAPATGGDFSPADTDAALNNLDLPDSRAN